MALLVWLLSSALFLAQTGDVQRVLDRPELAGATVSVVVIDVEAGRTLVAISPDELLAPASNMKLLTTAAALALLGPGASFDTRLLAAAAPDAHGVLSGDLVVQGGGDPCLRADVLIAEGLQDPGPLLATLIELAGLRRIDGEVLLDDGLFDRQWVHADWDPDDLGQRFAAPIGALSIHGNLLALEVDGGRSPSARVLTAASGYRLRNELRSAEDSRAFQVSALRPDGDGGIRLRGEVGLSVRDGLVEIPVRDPTDLFGRCLSVEFDRAGVGVRGAVRGAPGAAASLIEPVELASLSTPLVNALVIANKESDNSISDHVFKLLGARVVGDGSFEGGAQAVEAFLAGVVGVPTAELALRDGSGLSDQNRVSARVIAQLLVTMARADPEVRDPFLRTLPISGQDGTLHERLVEAPYAGAVRAKTGYISRVSSLSGYVRTSDERTLAFSILINGFNPQYGNRRMKAIQDDVCRILVDLP